MTFKTWQKRKRLNRRILQPNLPICGPRIKELLNEILATHFPEKANPPTIFFGNTPTLAHIEYSLSEQPSAIWMHHALNDPATPDYVFAHVLKHELLHTRIQPREVNGEWSAHPPEFWEEEKRIGELDVGRAWAWIYNHFSDALKRDDEYECIWVNNGRMRKLLHNRHCAEQDIRHLYDASMLGRKELRFGFRAEALRDFKAEYDKAMGPDSVRTARD
jgi:hypothetical protein